MDTTTHSAPRPDSFQKDGCVEYAKCARFAPQFDPGQRQAAPSLTPADLLPGVSLLCADPEQPPVTIMSRSSRGGVRFAIGDTHGWHWRADDLAQTLSRCGYEVAL